MIEVQAPRYHDVPCPYWTSHSIKGFPRVGEACMSNPGQRCDSMASGASHRQRRLLWAALAEAQSRPNYQGGIWWYGKWVQVTTRLVRS